MKTINTKFIKTAGLLLSLLLSNYSYAGFLDMVAFESLTTESSQTIKFNISSNGIIAAEGKANAKNIIIQIGLTGLELSGTTTDIDNASRPDNGDQRKYLSTYFDITYDAPTVRFTQKMAIPDGIVMPVSVPVSVTSNAETIKYAVLASKTFDRDSVKEVIPGSGAFFGNVNTITGGGGGATPPNYSIAVRVSEVSGGNNLGTDASKELPLNIVVTNNIASATNTGPVVVALAKDSRLALAATCAPARWTKSDNSVAYLFTYVNTDGSNTFAPDPTKTDSTIVCPVTVTRPTTQSGKLQLNAVLRHGSGDTSTSNDVSSIEVTYN